MMACCRINLVFGLALPGKRDSMELAGIIGQENTKNRLANRQKEYWLGVQTVPCNPQGTEIRTIIDVGAKREIRWMHFTYLWISLTFWPTLTLFYKYKSAVNKRGRFPVVSFPKRKLAVKSQLGIFVVSNNTDFDKKLATRQRTPSICFLHNSVWLLWAIFGLDQLFVTRSWQSGNVCMLHNHECKG